MPGEINRYVCKNCGKSFEYDKYSFMLKAEKGESRIERCEECRQPHGAEIKETKNPYLAFQSETFDSVNLGSSDPRLTFRGIRALENYTKEIGLAEQEFGITDEDAITLYERLEENQVVIVTAPTGAGKSTFLACRLIIPPEGYKGDLIDRLTRQGKIAITQPLTAAVQRIPERNADLLGCLVGPGQLLGLRHGTQSGGQEGERFDRWNVELTVTDGSLRNWIREGKLNEYSVIMVDEAHQRSCNIETILMLLKNELVRYPNLKVLISSATVNAERFRDTFREMGARADILNLDIASKRKHNYYVHFWKNTQSIQGCDCWLCQNSEERKSFWGQGENASTEFELPEAITRFVVKILKETEEGSILVFLHGETAIKDTAKRISEAKRRIDPSNKIPVLPVYRRIGEKEVERRFNLKGEKRRVLVTTNIAETSHTLDDVVYVIDSGYIKESDWDPDNEISALPSRRHSQDGCRQRWGRVGRNQEGYVFCLYAEDEFGQFDVHTSSEVTKSPLDEVMLALSSSGVTDLKTIPWIVKAEDFSDAEAQKKWQKELKRASAAISENQFVGKDGIVKEKAQEIFHVPRSSGDIDALALADEYNCGLETAIALFLMATRDGEPRTGVNLYSQGSGLLLWDPGWTASTKMRIWRLHQGLRLGCRDDLDFVVKLAYCFLRAEERGVALGWADYYQVNYERMKDALDNAREVFDFHYRARVQEEPRTLDMGILEMARQALSVIWRKKLVKISGGTIPTYPAATKGKIGVVSPQCAGSWQKKQKALAAAVVENKAVIQGYPQEVPNASFMVALPDQISDVFLDQRFPVGSLIKVREENGKFFLGDLVELPLPIKISYRKTLDLFEDYEEEDLAEEEEMLFNKDFLIQEEFAISVEGIWIGEKKAEKARIIEWQEKNEVPVAVLSSFAENEILTLGKKKGDFLGATIHRVVRDPIGRGGWISVKTEEGFDIPLELNVMSFSPLGPGLELTEGQTLSFAIKDIDANGFSQLSNIKKVIEDIIVIRKEISEKNAFPGYVVEINEEEEKATAVVVRENGVVHPFEIYKDFVPGREISNLRIGEEVIINLSMPRTERDHIRADLLTKEETDNIRVLKNWDYDREKNEISFPYCLEGADFNNWPARPEVIDFVKRHSWQYCLQARIASLKERLSKLNEMDLVEGVIQRIDYEEDKKTVKSVQVVVSGDIPGFAFGDDLGSLSVSEGERIPFCVKAVDINSGSLRLVSKRSEDEKKERHEEFISRAKANIQRWEDNIRKARENIAKNKARPVRTKEFGEKVKSWIEEDERKIRDWLDKIESARNRLR